jgi:ATP-dependent RNA helicase DDX24/MAK5
VLIFARQSETHLIVCYVFWILLSIAHEFIVVCPFQISSKEHSHLNDLSQIRFLVIDEADRMVQQGSFKELSSILDAVQLANPMDDDDDESDQEEEEEDDEADMENPGRMFSLPGIPGEARVEMLSDDILQQLERQREGNDPHFVEPVVKEIEDDEYEELERELVAGDEDDSEAEISLPAAPPVQRQTFVYSATLTLAASASYVKPKKGKGSRGRVDVDGAIAEILEKARAKGKTKIVDLTNAGKSGKTDESTGKKPPSSQIRLPPGLSLSQIQCTQRHKDSHLYAYLMTTAQGSSGPCLVFCNSIAGVRRVGETLQTLRLPVKILHANMQQVR